MKYKEIARRLKTLGCEELPRRGKGSHHIWHNPANGRIAPLPNWGAKDLKIGTLKAVIRQLGLEWEEFSRK